MHITKKKEYDYEVYGSRWKEIVWFGNVEYLEDVKRDLEAINKLSDTEFRDLSNEEFYSLISNFYTVFLTKKDILDILFKVMGVEYTKFEQLNSKMIYKDIVSEGHGRDFSWWEETYQVGWLVAAAKDLNLVPNYNYSKEEIKEMVEKKQIVSFGQMDKAIGFDPIIPYEEEKVEKIDMPRVSLDCENLDELTWDYETCFLFDKLKKDESKLSLAVYDEAVALIRRRINKKKVLNDCKKIILFLNENIHVVDDGVRNNYYMDKDGKSKYTDLSGEVKEGHKQLALRFLKNNNKS